ncbi:MAG: GspH/FimT family pseudopilin [Hyphomonas sp.]|nr:GspH/FimT family pseudopilin [Hyphomonas sp.]
MKSVKGFTLIELMIAISVLAILIAIAAPGLSGWIDSSSARAQTNQYRDMLTYARSEAISKGEPVRVKQLASGAWVVGTGDPASCTAATALRCFSAPRVDMTVTTNVTGQEFPAAGLVFNTQGQVRGKAPADSVAIQIVFPKHCEASRIISVNGIGRVRSVVGACS